MKIELKSNRIFLVKLFFPAFIVTALFAILYVAAIIRDSNLLKESPIDFVMFNVLLIIELSIMLFAKFYNGKSYVFTEQKISILKKGKYLEEINLNDVVSIKYYYFKFSYIITIFAGALNEGGVWKLHVKLKNGTKKELAFFAKKDVFKLKELYQDLLEIF